MEIAIFKNLEPEPGKTAPVDIQIERKLSICQCRGFLAPRCKAKKESCNFMNHGGVPRAT